MPTLNWIGKDRVIKYHNEVPFRLLNEKKKFSVNSNNTENLLIKGDNLEALKALLLNYYNKVKCIYIDPPYNTGNEKWLYNDNVNSPGIKKWLGKVVGPESEDLNRHDKWLCMMLPRLKLLAELLKDDGVIFVSIDDNEMHYLKILMEEIFRYTDVIVWKKSGEGRWGKMKNVTTFRKDHDYIIVGYNASDLHFNKIWEVPDFVYGYSNPDNDPRGNYKAGSISRKEEASNPDHRNYYTVISPSGRKITRQWDFSEEEFERLDKDILINKDGKKVSRIYWGKNGNNVPAIKIFLNEKRYVTSYSVFLNKGTTTGAKEELREIFDLTNSHEDVFPNPKPTSLIKTLIQLTTDKESIILDSFVGSGTTGHAVLDLNKEDGGNRKFILVEMENDIVENITAERLKRVIQGYSYEKNNGEEVRVEGLGGGFKFLELSNPLFDKHKQIIGEPSYEDLAGYVYFSETRNTIDWRKANRNDLYMGEKGGVHYFIIYGGKAKSELGVEFMKIAKRYEGEKIVYADTLMLDDDELEKYDIVFKQIPYEIKTF